MSAVTRSDDEFFRMQSTLTPGSRSSTPVNSPKTKRARLSFPFGACRVCSDSATGIHYGIATCEGCKGFFKRSILRKEKYRCYFDNSCMVNVTNRNRCKACRFRRCLSEGMSVDGVKMGRIPKLVKERALREQREEQMKQAAALKEVNQKFDEVHARESSCSSLSDRSIENYDPNVMEIDSSNVQAHCDSTKPHSDKGSVLSKEQTIISSTKSEYDINSNKNRIQTIQYRTKYPTFLPDDFTLDETCDLIEYSRNPLSNDLFNHMTTLSSKLIQNKSNFMFQLTDDELRFTRYIRWSCYSIYFRHSKRVKQLEKRMIEMVNKNINEYPGGDATHTQFFATVPKTLEVIVRSSVYYIQELPGMSNIDSNNLHKLILHRSFDWFMLKYGCLLHENGQSYFLSPEGLQYTRRWMNVLYGINLTDSMFQFSHAFRELNLNDREISLIIPLQMCCPDSALADQELIRMLRACYLYSLYEELCQHHGLQEGRVLCSRILRILDILAPLSETYEKNVGSRILEA